MPIFDPELLADWTGGNWNHLPCSLPIGFSIDARKINQGEVFVCISGHRDGHDFIKQAGERGASAALVDHFVDSSDLPQLKVSDTIQSFQEIARQHRNTFTGKIIGVTGSCGKTTTKEALGLLLPFSLSTEANLNNYLGVPLTLTRISHENHRFAVVEAGINMRREMDGLTQMIHPEVVIITSIGDAHLQGLESNQIIAEEKIKLWTQSSDSALGIFPEEFSQYSCFSTAINQKNHLMLLDSMPNSCEIARQQAHYLYSTETNRFGHSSTLTVWRHECPPLVVSLPSVSKGVARNLALSCLAAWKLGITDEEICERLPQYSPSALRGTRLAGRGCEYLVDCYNANPASVKDSAEFFTREFHGTPKLFVLAGMMELGEKSSELHYQTGASIHIENLDQVILIGEQGGYMAEGLLSQGVREDQIIVLHDSSSARPLIEEFRGAVLFKGSRSYKLEDLIPEWAVEKGERLQVLSC